MISRRGMHNDNGFCTSSQRNCTRRKLDGYQFCWRHILEDRGSPYRQCSRVSAQTGRRCSNAAPKSDRKEGLCPEHQMQAVQSSRKDAARRRSQTAASLLERLEHYRPVTTSRPVAASGGGGDAAATTLTATTRLLSKQGSSGLQPTRAVVAQPVGTDAIAVGWTSSDDSCTEELPCELAWRGEPNSDDDSIDSEADDPFKYTDVFTEEEAVKITREKLIRLQSLYLEQFKHLQQRLVDSRRRFLAATAKVDGASPQGVSASPHYLPSTVEAAGSAAVSTASNILARERKRAALRYRKRTGVEALMHRRSKERHLAATRSGSAQDATPLPAMQRCSAGYGRAGRCSSRVVPLSKYCLRHISSDPHQVLFKRCSFLGRCERHVPSVFSSAPRCDQHEGFSSGRAAAIIQQAAVVQQAQCSVATAPVARTAQPRRQRPLPAPAREVENGTAGSADAMDAVAAPPVCTVSAELSLPNVGAGDTQQNASVIDTCAAELDRARVGDALDTHANLPHDNEN